jgi:hypothetical protein
MYLTHYGPVGDVERLGADLHEQIDAMTAFARAAADKPDRHAWLCEVLADLYAGRAAAHGWHGGRQRLRELLGMDIELNAQGLEVWLEQSGHHAGATRRAAH